MDVSGRDKKNLKSGAPNFEKQKNESIFKFGENSLFSSISCVHTKMSKDLAMKKNMLILHHIYTIMFGRRLKIIIVRIMGGLVGGPEPGPDTLKNEEYFQS